MPDHGEDDGRAGDGPKLGGTTERFAAQPLGTGVTRTNALEALVIAGFHSQSVQRRHRGDAGRRAGSAGQRDALDGVPGCEEIKMQVEASSRRRLDDVRLDYLFLDGSHVKYHKYHANAAAEPVLATWGIDTEQQAGVRRPGHRRQRVR